MASLVRRQSVDNIHKIKKQPDVTISSSSSTTTLSAVVSSSGSQGHRHNVSFNDDVKKIISGERDRIIQEPLNDKSKETEVKSLQPQNTVLPDSPLPSKSPSPKSNSGNISPRKLVNQVVNKLNKKLTPEEEIAKQKEKFGHDIYDGKDVMIGPNNFDMCYYASLGDMEKLKTITDTGKYTPDDLKTVAEAARKCGKFEIAKFLEELYDE